MNVFAIIVTYNALHRNWIDKCLKSLQESTMPVVPIIVDNCSTDGTQEHVSANFSDAVFLPQEKNLGFGQANNVGIRYALEHEADYILLLNQDATIEPEALESMIKASHDTMLVSPLQLNGDGTALDIIFKKKLLKTKSPIFDDIFSGHSLQEYYIGGDYSAACWLMPVSLVKNIGGFDPIFFHYGEDDNYLQRVRFHGLKMALVPKARMYHDRKVHGNQEAFDKNAYQRELLNIVTDINLSWGGIMLKLLKKLFQSYAHHLLDGTYLPGTFTLKMLSIVRHIRAIRISRRTNKVLSVNWL